MQRSPVFGSVARHQARGASSIACLAFVGVMAVAFWAGAVWIGNTLLSLLS
jgi:hypothetical protein